MRRLCVLVTCSVLALGLASFTSAADQSFMPNVDPADGWLQVNDGYWERMVDGKLQTVAVGPQGLEQVLANLRAELSFLVEEYLANPNDEMRYVLDTHVSLIASIEAGLEKQIETPKALPAGWCEWDWDAGAGGRKICTNWASADVSYAGSSAGDCLGLCDLYAYAYVSRTLCNDTVVTQSASCFKNDVINEECDVDASLSNVPIKSCYAYGFASIYCADYNYYQSDTATSTSCGWLCIACPIEPIPHEER